VKRTRPSIRDREEEIESLIPEATANKTLSTQGQRDREREGKVLRVLLLGRWLPRNQG